ncbi:hydrogenase nickel incorporation protein HypB [Azospirillum picis]|uniref:Hydrogenase maturation factor HypB n=1 Tax=Azospirillum picis TaxID=488438 RepID=A0ABU0MSL8_9PROT|nr:hydrogenase nickel incorporation protein HypB [Azospirillum picis]MBP2302653.1 hydrogenase nickel incorporation protein HypB [Azospirillum picis]MDQ0536314.1 hydrogenase nickel incorporation protein HypB [Azospirillum picis]
MCDTCGCAVTPGNHHLFEDGSRLASTADGRRTIEVLENLLHENDHAADHNRQHFDAAGVFVVNLMSSPGSGKTSLLEATVHALPPGIRMAVIEGDLETENDAERIRRHGVPAVQIVTGTACHLDAHMVHQALHAIDLGAVDILFVENVGNLVCPANFDLGQHSNVLLLSVTEGDDKPAKYPVMFRAADRVLVTKADLAVHLPEFDAARARAAIHALKPGTPVQELSAKSGQGLEPWITWLTEAVALRRSVQQERGQPRHA